jgi:hypothetical protein
MSEDEIISPYSIFRCKKAIEEKREPFRDGRPPYLEKEEKERWVKTIINETLECHYLTVGEMANLVFIINILVIFMIFSGWTNKRKKSANGKTPK